MLNFIILCVIAASSMVAWRFYQQHIENKLRENFPRRSVIEVSLPRGIVDSNKRMMKFYKRVVNATQGDEKARKSGDRQIDIIYLAETRPGHTMPQIRFLIYADADKMKGVKTALKGVFDGMADVTELDPDDDPMEQIAAEMRPPKVPEAPAPAPEITQEEEA